MGTVLHGEGAEQSHGPRRRAARPGRARAYAQARRHSSLVRLLRILIPVGSALAVGILVVFAFFNPFAQQAGLSIQAVGVTGTQVTMQSPRMTGHRGDNRPYEVTATMAVQDVRKPNVIELRQMQARLTVDDAGNHARLRAETGLFDSGRERLDLKGRVQVETDQGQKADLLSASIDFKANTVVSREPVKVTLTNGVIEAETLDVVEGGKVITFTGRVRSVFTDPPSGAAAQPPVQGAPAAAPPAAPAPAVSAPAPPRAAPAAKPASRTAAPQAVPTRTSQAATPSRYP